MALPLWKDITEITPKLTYGINRFFNSNSCYVHKTFGKKGLKKCIFLQSYSQQHDSHWPINRSNPSVHGQPIPQTVVYTEWNLIRPFQDGSSDNATVWMKLWSLYSVK